MSSFTTPPLCSSSRPPSCPYQPQHPQPKMDWFKDSRFICCRFHAALTQPSVTGLLFKQTKKQGRGCFVLFFCHYLRKMFRLVSAVFFRIAASLLWLVLLSAVFLPVPNLTDPLGRPHPQLPDSLWRRESQMCSLSPSSGCFSALVLFSFLSIVFFFFCFDGFSLVQIHDRVIYFFSGPVITNFWSSCFSNSCLLPEKKKSNFNMKRQNQPFWDKPCVFLWAPRRRLDKQCHTCEKGT